MRQRVPIAAFVSTLFICLATAAAADAAVQNYCNKVRVAAEKCYARNADGAQSTHTYNDNWLVVSQGHGYYGCAYMRRVSDNTVIGDCDDSNNAYFSIGDNQSVTYNAWVQHAEAFNLTLQGSAVY